MIKKKLAKKMRQNRPIPHWIRLRTDNTIRATMVGTRNVLLSMWFEFGYIGRKTRNQIVVFVVQCQAQALAQNQARILSESSRLLSSVRFSISPSFLDFCYKTFSHVSWMSMKQIVPCAASELFNGT
ncbi:hypothetical protein F2Q68_00029074 [Brassica cretica]|uniref:Ribosomal protein L39e n=1 Tax=Brassica cretica TaxID=69181 RepID=A0A8S9G9M1_BRACR|nr:hypothetical protein F2Q68_00029074 [Brassica cretica]